MDDRQKPWHEQKGFIIFALVVFGIICILVGKADLAERKLACADGYGSCENLY